MQTSKQWWEQVKANPAKLIDWLKDQYHGERTAAIRIKEEFAKVKVSPKDQLILNRIAKEEDLHADWVGDLLKARGITPEVLVKEERYWKATMHSMNSKEDLAAIAHHAEHMRLERIKVIVEDEATPLDIKTVFAKILPMEIRHERWFATLSTPQAITAHKEKHELGLQVLGLTI